VRPLRSTLAAALVAVAATAAPSSAAPPVGCYGLPSVPSAFVCITSFTPGNALVPVTVPEACAGTCYGPITVVSDDGNSTILVYTYQGQEHEVRAGDLPDLPDLPELPDVVPTYQACPGSRPVAPRDTSPFVCAHRETTWDGETIIYVGTCVGAECTVLAIPTSQAAEALGDEIARIKDDPKGYLCPGRSTGICG